VIKPLETRPHALEQLFLHPLTDLGLTGFLNDREKAREVPGGILELAGARETKP
jgi:hypothetical protein